MSATIIKAPKKVSSILDKILRDKEAHKIEIRRKLASGEIKMSK